MAAQDDPLSRRRLDRRIVALALPALGALAADPLLSLADTAFVARLGTVPLAALGIDAALFAFAFFAFNFLAYVTTPMVARRLGAGDVVGAGRIVIQAVSLATFLGVAVSVVLMLAAEPLVRLMQAPPEVVAPAVSYLRIRALAAPAMLVVTAGHGAFRGFQDTRTPLVITVGVNIVNLVLDPLLIFGFGLGLEGAAIATVVAQVVGAGWFVVLLVGRGRTEAWSWRLPGWGELIPMLQSGGILTVRTLLLSGTLMIATAVAASLGSVEVAAHQVVAQTWFLLAMTVDALAISAQAMIADELGRDDSAAAATVARRLAQWGLVAGVVLGLVLFAFRGALGVLFGPEPEVRALIGSATVVAAAMQPAAALVFVADGVYLGLLKVKYLAYSTALGALTGGALLWTTVVSGWGLVGVWWALAAMIAGRLLVLAVAYPRALASA